MCENSSPLDLRVGTDPQWTQFSYLRCRTNNSGEIVHPTQRSWPFEQSQSDHSESSVTVLICPVCRNVSSQLHEFAQHMSFHVTMSEMISKDHSEVLRSSAQPSMLVPHRLLSEHAYQTRWKHVDEASTIGINNNQVQINQSEPNVLSEPVDTSECPPRMHCNTEAQYPGESSLLAHIHAQHLCRVYKCLTCEQTFASKLRCTEHILCHHFDLELPLNGLSGSQTNCVTSDLHSKIERSKPSTNSYNGLHDLCNPNSKDTLKNADAPENSADFNPVCVLSHLWFAEVLQKLICLETRSLFKSNLTQSSPSNKFTEFDRNDKLQLPHKLNNSYFAGINASLSKASQTQCTLTNSQRTNNFHQDCTQHVTIYDGKSANCRWFPTHPVRQLIPLELASKLVGIDAVKLCHLCLTEFEDEMAVLRHQVQSHSMQEKPIKHESSLQWK